MWTGIGVLVAVPALLLNLEVLQGRLNNPEPPPIVKKEQHESSVEFSISKLARCPGGGDWIGRERNNRSRQIEFLAPNGAKIESASLEDVDTHHGRVGPIEEIDGGVRVRLSCNPPNYPGAPGGWARATLVGSHSIPGQ